MVEDKLGFRRCGFGNAIFGTGAAIFADDCRFLACCYMLSPTTPTYMHVLRDTIDTWTITKKKTHNVSRHQDQESKTPKHGGGKYRASNASHGRRLPPSCIMVPDKEVATCCSCISQRQPTGGYKDENSRSQTITSIHIQNRRVKKRRVGKCYHWLKGVNQTGFRLYQVPDLLQKTVLRIVMQDSQFCV